MDDDYNSHVEAWQEEQDRWNYDDYDYNNYGDDYEEEEDERPEFYVEYEVENGVVTIHKVVLAENQTAISPRNWDIVQAIDELDAFVQAKRYLEERHKEQTK